MRTLRRKVIVVTVPLVVIVVALLMTIGDAGPPAAVSFLRYDDNRQTAIFQITNLSRSPVVWECWAYYSLHAGRTNRASILGDHVYGVMAHHELELRIPMKILENSDVRPSRIKVLCWIREGQLQKRFRGLLRSLGVSAEAERFEATFDLSK